MKKGRWIAAGVSTALVGVLAIGLGAAQAKSSGLSDTGGTRQTVATCEAMHESMHSSSGGQSSAQCQAMHDQMDQMMGGDMGSGMMGSGSGMMGGTVGSDMMDGSGDQADGPMASHHGSSSAGS